MNYASLEKVLACPNLPTLPAVALKVLELTSQPDVSLKQVAAVIENDQAIATKVLRTVNSSFYGLSRRCGSIQQALALLGLQTVKGLVLGFSLAKSVDGGGDKEISFDFMTYWRRSMYTAAAARHIANLTKRCDPDEAFVTALIQDIGEVALWRSFGDTYLQTMDLAGKDHNKLAAVERKTFDLDHTSVASEMTRRWRFPEQIVNAVRWHHASESAPQDALQLTRTVVLAGMVAAVICSDKSGNSDAIHRLRVAAAEWFDLKGNQPLTMLQTIADLAQQMARVFNLNVGEQPDIDALLAQANAIREEQVLPHINLDEVLESEARDLTDPVSGLPDRTVFLRDLDAAMAVLSQGGMGLGVGVVIVGMDDAKWLNDRFGPLGADAMLRNVGSTLIEAAGRFGRPYRFVGAGFIVLLPKVDAEQLCRVAENMRRKVHETTYTVEGLKGSEQVRTTVTCGVAMIEGDPSIRANEGIQNRDQLLRAAMIALASGQQGGQNRVVVYRKETPPQQKAA